jgi:hypothetical protein
VPTPVKAPASDEKQNRFDSIVRPSVPAARLGALRALVGGFVFVYLVARFAHLWRLSGLPAEQFQPVGVLRLLDNSLGAWQWHLLLVVTTALSLAFALGLFHRILAPVFALALLLTISYRNSWGMIFHTENLMVLHVAVLALAPAARGWSLDQRRQRREYSDSWHYGWPIFLMSMVTVSAYALAGYAKLRFGGLSWAEGDVLRNYVAMDNLRTILLGDLYSPLAAPSMRLGAVFTLLAGGSLALELLAPISLFSTRFARLWVPAMVAFHVGIVALMAIVFPYPLCGVAFASFYRCEKLMERLARTRMGKQIEVWLKSPIKTEG